MARNQEASRAADIAQLAALGYPSNFNRSMSLWQNFALGFTYLSPLTSAYSLLALGLATDGPPMAWSYLVAACGMMMVCLVFGEIVSQFPISGGVYPWARRLVGRRWSWMTGWLYGWAMYATIAGAAVAAAPFLASLIGISVARFSTAVVALALVTITTFVNLLGTRTLARVAMIGFICEIVGALVVSGWLLAYHRVQPLSVFVTDFGFAPNGSFLPAFLSSALVGMFCCYGFEACGDVAEETPNPGCNIPKSMRMTIYVGISVTIFAVMALILAIPDMQAVISGRVASPVAAILTEAFGPKGYRTILVVVLVSFVSCVLSLQAAVSRLVFSYARDGMIVGDGVLSRMSQTRHVPVPSLVLAWIIPSLILCIGFFLQNALAAIIGFASAGIYLSFQMVVVAAIYARWKGWRPNGEFMLGVWAWPVNILALIYGVAAIVNVLWPRSAPGTIWYVGFGQPMALACIFGVGIVYLFIGRPEGKSNAPAGDAWTFTAVPLASKQSELSPLVNGNI